MVYQKTEDFGFHKKMNLSSKFSVKLKMNTHMGNRNDLCPSKSCNTWAIFVNYRIKE